MALRAWPPRAWHAAGKRAPTPGGIAVGLDPIKPDLLERRKPWNKLTPADLGLPTEIWRETIARRQRCTELRKKLAAGEVRNIDDLITLNLDLRRFAQDVITRCDSPELLAAIWHALAGRAAPNPTSDHNPPSPSSTPLAALVPSSSPL